LFILALIIIKYENEVSSDNLSICDK